MNHRLFAWISGNDLKSKNADPEASGHCEKWFYPGPTALAALSAAKDRIPLTHVHLLSNYSVDIQLGQEERKRKRAEEDEYGLWLKKRLIQAGGGKCKIQIHRPDGESPYKATSNFKNIYSFAESQLRAVLEAEGKSKITYQMSSGTPLMGAAWLLLCAKEERYHGTILESSVPGILGVVEIDFGEYSEGLRRAIYTPARVEDQDFVQECDAMKQLLERAKIFALANHPPVLIRGETGTGKEMIAHWIHELSARSKAPFLAVNCGNFSGELLRSELFGYEKGSHSQASKTHKGVFECANGGTLFLDEIGEMPIDAQARLLRAIGSRGEGQIQRLGGTEMIKVNVRVVAATNRDLRKMVREGSFREDLYYRLSTLKISVPPLRERGPEEIERIFKLYLEKAAKEEGAGSQLKRPCALSEEARRRLIEHSWPGNVREVQAVVTNLFLLSPPGEPEISAKLVDQVLLENETLEADPLALNLGGAKIDLDGSLGRIEAAYVRDALQRSRRKAEAADRLGLSDQTLQNRINKLRKLGYDLGNPGFPLEAVSRSPKAKQGEGSPTES